MFRAAIAGTAVKVYGDGLQVRDYVYVDDAVAGFLLAWDLERQGPLIIGGGKSVDVHEVHRAACAATGVAIKLENSPAVGGEMRAVRVDLALARSLGYEPGQIWRPAWRSPGRRCAPSSKPPPRYDGMTLLGDDDALEAAAIADFERANPSLRFGSVAVIIPSYREAESLGGVLREIPKEVEGRPVATLVVVDGPDDGAARIAREAGAYACATGDQRGQGAALRLGYRVAAAHGAAYVVSLDADGQYPPSEIPVVLGPVLRGEADFRLRLAAPGQRRDHRRATFARRGLLRSRHRRPDRPAHHRSHLRAACYDRRGRADRDAAAAPVPGLRAADRRGVARLPPGRAARHHPGAQRWQVEEGPQRAVCAALRAGGARHVAPGTRAQGLRAKALDEELRFLVEELRFPVEELRFLVEELRFLVEELRFLVEELRVSGRKPRVSAAQFAMAVIWRFSAVPFWLVRAVQELPLILRLVGGV